MCSELPDVNLLQLQSLRKHARDKDLKGRFLSAAWPTQSRAALPKIIPPERPCLENVVTAVVLLRNAAPPLSFQFSRLAHPSCEPPLKYRFSPCPLPLKWRGNVNVAAAESSAVSDYWDWLHLAFSTFWVHILVSAFTRIRARYREFIKKCVASVCAVST